MQKDNLIGDIKDKAVSAITKPWKLSEKLESMSIPELEKIQAFGGTTMKESAKAHVINQAVWADDFATIDTAKSQLSLCTSMYNESTKIGIANEFASVEGRVSWDDISQKAKTVKDAKLIASGSVLVVLWKPFDSQLSIGGQLIVQVRTIDCP